MNNFDDLIEWKKLKEIQKRIDKICCLLNYMVSSDTILSGEYFVIHSDYVYDLIKEIKEVDTVN